MPKYWRTKASAEVDFVVELENKIIPIEVKLNAEPGKIETGLRAFINMYKPKKAIVITYRGKKGNMKINNCNVYFTDITGMKKLLTSK